MRPLVTSSTTRSLMHAMFQLQRHGARQPSGSDGDAYHDAVKKLLKAKKKISKHSSLGFIKDYKYVLKHDDLVELGAKQ